MKLVLIDPVTTAESLPAAKRASLRRGIGYPGNGLLTVAALTPPEVDVRYIDESVEDIDAGFQADLVGISVQAPTAPYAYKLASRYRARGHTVVLGGIHVSLNPDEAERHADAIVVGEAELTWPRLLNDFRANRLEKVYRAERLVDLDESPVPRRELLRTSSYQIPYVVQASKGCPYGCDFCSLHAFVGHTPRYRSIPKVIEEIRSLPSNRFIFADDNLYCDPTYTKDLLRELATLDVHWAAEATWHMARDHEALTLAKNSGCIGLFVGFDSLGNHAAMRKVPRCDSVEQKYVDAMRTIVDHGIAVVAAFVFGLDEDDPSVFERSVRIAIEGGASLVNFSVLVPYPGTPIHQRFSQSNRLIEQDLSKFISPNVCFVPKRMTVEQLAGGVRWAQKEFYSYRSILKTSLHTAQKLGWGMGLFALKLNMAQRANWGRGSDAEPEESALYEQAGEMPRVGP